MTVANTGNRAVEEIVQVYLNDRFTSVCWPVKKLKAWQRVAIPAGEERTVRCTIPYADLALCDAAGHWVVEPGEFDPRLAAGPLGPSRESEIRFVAMLRVPGGISDLETWILCNLAKNAKRVFEFGTATGKTTYLLAANAPADAEIVTLTLAPEQAAKYAQAAGDDSRAREAAREELMAVFVRSGGHEGAGLQVIIKFAACLGMNRLPAQPRRRGRAGSYGKARHPAREVSSRKIHFSTSIWCSLSALA